MCRRGRRRAVGEGAAGGYVRPRPTMVWWRSKVLVGPAAVCWSKLKMLQGGQW